MAKSKTAKYWTAQAVAARDLVDVADDWRMIAAMLADAIRTTHLAQPCERPSCHLCDALTIYREARRG